MRADNKVSMRFISSTSRTERALALVTTMQNMACGKDLVSPVEKEAEVRSILKTESGKEGPIDVVSG